MVPAPGGLGQDMLMGSELPYRVWWDEASGVTHVEWAPGSVCGLADAQGATAAAQALGHGLVPVLVDMRLMSRIDRPGREHFTNSPGDVTAVALLVGSAVSKMIANFVIGMQRIRFPIRMFTDESEALAWLDAHRG